MAQSGHLEHHGDVDVGGQSPFALFPQDVTDERLHDAGDDDRTRTAAEGGSGNIGESCVLFVVLFILIVFVCGLHAGRVSCFDRYFRGWICARVHLPDINVLQTPRVAVANQLILYGVNSCRCLLWTPGICNQPHVRDRKLRGVEMDFHPRRACHGPLRHCIVLHLVRLP